MTSSCTSARLSGPPAFDCTAFFRSSSFDLSVALEGQPLDGRIFHDRDQDVRAVAHDLHVFEQAGAVKALDCRIERCGIEGAVGGRMKMRANHVGVDVPVAGDRDHRRGLACRPDLPGRKGHPPANKKAEKRRCHPTKHERRSAAHPART
jgi:hypothetical protein